MYGHVTQYLDKESLRLRAERAERLARGWRNAALILLGLLCIQTLLVIDTATELRRARLASAQPPAPDTYGASVWFNAAMTCQANLTQESAYLEEAETALFHAMHRSVNAENATEAAEKRFSTCLAANAGLVEVIRESERVINAQRLLVHDALALANVCKAQQATWVVLPPPMSEVRFDAR